MPMLECKNETEMAFEYYVWAKDHIETGFAASTVPHVYAVMNPTESSN